MEQLMEQRGTDTGQRLKLVPEQVDFPLVNSAGHAKILCPREHLFRRIPDPNRGLMRKLVDAVLNFLGYDVYAHPVRRHQWD
jgi:hypothetical protein